MYFEPNHHSLKTATGTGRGLFLWKRSKGRTEMVLRADLAYAQSAANLYEYRVSDKKNLIQVKV